MIYNHKEMKEKYKSDYQIGKAIEDKKIYKIEKNIYSDTPEINFLEIISKKYVNAIFTMDSAFYFHNLTDVIPSKITLATKRNALRIKDDKIIQVFTSEKLFEIGKTQMVVEGVNINIYNKERMLIELIRNKKQMAFDYYKELISNYRKSVDSLNMSKLEEYIEKFPYEEHIYEILQKEVF